MKTSRFGIVAVAILLAVTGIGFGIAQAGGTHTDRPVISFEDQEALDYQRPGVLETSVSSSPYVENRPVLGFEDQELPQLAKPQSEDMQLENPVETGSLPAEGGIADFIP